MKVTQPVLLQNYNDEFDLDEQRPNPRRTIDTGKVPSKKDGSTKPRSCLHKDMYKGNLILTHFRGFSPSTYAAMKKKCFKNNHDICFGQSCLLVNFLFRFLGVEAFVKVQGGR